MFQSLRQGSPFFILEKSRKGLELKSGVVESVSVPQPKYSTYPPYTQDTTVNIKVRVGDGTMEFNQVPSNLSVANFGTSNVIISESKDSIISDIEALMQTSRQALSKENVEYNQSVLSTGEQILKSLNPVYAKEQERDASISNLRNEVDTIKSDISSMSKNLEAFLKAMKETSKTK